MVRCTNQPSAKTGHLYETIPVHLLSELNFLTQRFGGLDIPEQEDTCGIILQNNVRRRTCGRYSLIL